MRRGVNQQRLFPSISHHVYPSCIVHTVVGVGQVRHLVFERRRPFVNLGRGRFPLGCSGIRVATVPVTITEEERPHLISHSARVRTSDGRDWKSTITAFDKQMKLLLTNLRLPKNRLEQLTQACESLESIISKGTQVSRYSTKSIGKEEADKFREMLKNAKKQSQASREREGILTEAGGHSGGTLALRTFLETDQRLASYEAKLEEKYTNAAQYAAHKELFDNQHIALEKLARFFPSFRVFVKDFQDDSKVQAINIIHSTRGLMSLDDILNKFTPYKRPVLKNSIVIKRPSTLLKENGIESGGGGNSFTVAFEDPLQRRHMSLHSTGFMKMYSPTAHLAGTAVGDGDRSPIFPRSLISSSMPLPITPATPPSAAELYPQYFGPSKLTLSVKKELARRSRLEEESIAKELSNEEAENYMIIPTKATYPRAGYRFTSVYRLMKDLEGSLMRDKRLRWAEIRASQYGSSVEANRRPGRAANILDIYNSRRDHDPYACEKGVSSPSKGTRKKQNAKKVYPIRKISDDYLGANNMMTLRRERLSYVEGLPVSHDLMMHPIDGWQGPTL